MKTATLLVCRFALFAGLAALSARAQDEPPVEPFQAIHLIKVDAQHPDAEKTLLAAIADLNKAIATAGCPKCIYHLWKATGGDQSGGASYMQVSSWPGREVYNKVHNSPEYAQATKNWDKLRSVVTEETYNRFVELTPPK